MRHTRQLKLKYLCILFLFIINYMNVMAQNSGKNESKAVTITLISASDPKIHYTGRIDKHLADQYKYSAPGVYIEAKFKGTACSFDMAAEGSQNYIEIVLDNGMPERIPVDQIRKTYIVASGLSNGIHTVLICKDTEAGMGSLFFYGFRCEELINFPAPERKIECYGNSITCGAKMITGELCEQTSNWNAPNKAYASYGAVTARELNAQWVLTSVSGIGLIHSCCGMPNTMPTTYDRLFLEKPETEKWNFGQYIPDVVTICLGQNDGAIVVASNEFRTKYIEFVKALISKYPSASFFLLTSPMADLNLFNAMKSSIDIVIQQLNTDGITKIYKIELPYNLTHGCQSHPNETEHIAIAKVLTNAIKEKMGW